PADNPRYQIDHVLPFGYWLSKQQWIPTVHIGDEQRGDIDHDDGGVTPYETFYFMNYDKNCSVCHTTLPMGDWLLRKLEVNGTLSPYPLALSWSDYLRKQQRTPLAENAAALPTLKVNRLMTDLTENRLPARILHLGIQCEACHNGCKE